MAKHIYIVEDEPLISDSIAHALEKEGYKVCGIADNAKEALYDIDELQPDLILLDINLIGSITGIELAEKINLKFKIPFIFLTSLSDENTINQVKKTNPSGFISKPFNETGLRSNIEIALFKFTQKKEDEKLRQNTFFIKNKGELIKINKTEINYIEAYDNYSKLICEKKEYLLSFTLKSMCEKLADKNFIRIHRSYLININKIDSLFDGYVFIDHKKLPIGKSYKKGLMNSISLL
ncbi:LytR/AlgR family response regulator transcription factor [Lutibacter sp.]